MTSATPELQGDAMLKGDKADNGSEQAALAAMARSLSEVMQRCKPNQKHPTL